MTPLEAALRVRDAALRDLDRFDRQDRGSRWLTHPDEGQALGEAVRLADAEVERLSS
jgi:hypothetical protein